MDSFKTYYDKEKEQELLLSTGEEALVTKVYDHVPYIGFGGISVYPETFE